MAEGRFALCAIGAGCRHTGKLRQLLNHGLPRSCFGRFFPCLFKPETPIVGVAALPDPNQTVVVDLDRLHEHDSQHRVLVRSEKCLRAAPVAQVVQTGINLLGDAADARGLEVIVIKPFRRVPIGDACGHVFPSRQDAGERNAILKRFGRVVNPNALGGLVRSATVFVRHGCSIIPHIGLDCLDLTAEPTQCWPQRSRKVMPMGAIGKRA